MDVVRKILTLVVIEKDGHVLLGMKKRGFGAGHYNGFGGKLEPGETILEAAKRELFEEASLTATALEKKGILEFTFADSSPTLVVHIFGTDSYDGVPVESEEMKPEWFPVDAIPFAKMWPDDEYWFPYFLKGKLFKGTFHFDAAASPTHTATILSHQIEVCDVLPE